jgi:hypothetical protein
MSTTTLGALPEYEFEDEFEDEAEEFFRTVAGLARRAAQHPGLRRVGLAAARSALGGLGGVGAAVGGAPGSRGARIGGSLGTLLGQELTGLLPAQEFEYEDEFEGEWEVNPIRRAYPDALMEHLGHAAAQARTEAEAEAFLGALVPLAARVVPRAAPALLRAAPQLIRGIAGAARVLRRDPATRPLLRAMPTVVRRTAQTLAQQAPQRPVAPQQAVRTLARQTAAVVGDPARCAGAFRRSQALDRRYHRAAAGRPVPALR